MSGKEESLYADDWLKVARRDWHRIHVLLNDGDADGAGFFLQQTLEKYLKAFLLSHGWSLRKVHTLQSLLDEAVAFAPDAVSLRPLCERVSGFSTLESAIQVLGLKDCKLKIFVANCLMAGC